MLLRKPFLELLFTAEVVGLRGTAYILTGVALASAGHYISGF